MKTWQAGGGRLAAAFFWADGWGLAAETTRKWGRASALQI